ncbi:MAG: MarR family winged helix-turn-helix transcriptional regulator [Sphingopyxis sp.]
MVAHPRYWPLMRDPNALLPGYALRRASTAMMAELGARLAPLGLRSTDVSILLVVDANPGITQSVIGRALDIQRANMAPFIARLAERGWVARQRVDGRSQGLLLTPDGRALMAQVRTVIDRFEDDLLNRIPAEHRAHFLPALQALWIR